MEVQRGKCPDTIERPISIEFKKDEVLELFASFVSRQLNSKVRFTSLKSGADSTTLVLIGGESLPLTWNGTTPVIQPIPQNVKPSGPEPEHVPTASPKV